MDRKVPLIIATAIIILAAAMVLLTQDVRDMSFPDDRVPVVDIEGTCSITYVTEGAVPSDAPITYLPGTYMNLCTPYNDGLWFEGWYSDPECTVPFGAITSSTAGDLVLYAAWSDFSREGFWFSMDMLIEYGPSHDRTVITGSMKWTYMVLSDSGSGWYVQRETVQVTSDGETVNTDGYWTGRSSSSDDYRYVGNGEVDGLLCEMWSDGKGETQWIHRNTVVMKIEYSMGTNHQLFTMSGQGHITPELGFHPDVSVQNGLTAVFDGEFTIGSEATLTAYGDDFQGWYIDGELTTTDSTLVLEEVDPNLAIEARCSTQYTVLSDGNVDPGEFGMMGDITVFDSMDRIVCEGSGPFTLDSGYYRLSSDVDGITVFQPVFVEDSRTFTHTWTYRGQSHTVSIDLLLSRVMSDAFGDPMSEYRMSLGPDMDARFLSADNAYISELVSALEPMVVGMDDTERAEFILVFVQTIPYKTDPETRGVDEFFKYPAETLWDGGGDCEDSSFLYASIMSALGYRTSVAMFPTHAMAGIVLDPLESSYDTFTSGDGTVYVFAETTGTGTGVWRTSPSYQATDVLYVVQSD